jgi:uncharacterized protein (DUF58 family)
MASRPDKKRASRRKRRKDSARLAQPEHPSDYLDPEVLSEVAGLELRARFLVEGFLAGAHRSPYKGFSSEFSEHRLYTKGDDPKNIDWNVYARTGRYYVKQFRAETSRACHLVIDASGSMGYGTTRLSKFQYALSVAGALGYMLLRGGDAVGGVTVGEDLADYLRPRARPGQLLDLLHLFHKCAPTGRGNLARGLETLASITRRRGLILLMSDLLMDLPPVFDALGKLRYRGHEVILFHILDESEATFPFQGYCRFESVEDGAVLEADAEAARPHYEEALAAFFREIDEQRARLGIDCCRATTGRSFGETLSLFFRQRDAMA